MKTLISLFTGLPHDSSMKLVTCRRLLAIESRLHLPNSPEMCLTAQSVDHSSLSSLSLCAFSFMRLPNETVIAITLLLYLERSGGRPKNDDYYIFFGWNQDPLSRPSFHTHSLSHNHVHSPERHHNLATIHSV